MTHRPSVAFLCVNYFSEELSSNCLRSVLEAEPLLKLEMEFWIVDNGSCRDWGPLLQGIPNVHLISTGANLGFAKAANRGIRQIQADYIFLINPDSTVCPNAVSSMFDYMEASTSQNVAILGPRVFHDEAKTDIQFSARSFPTRRSAAGSILRTTGIWKNNPWSRKYLKSDWNHDDAMPVDWVSGCCMFLRQETLEQIGLFDESYFMYVEDVDLCRRAWNSGWEVQYFPKAEIVHQIGASSKFLRRQMIVEHHRSMWIYFRKFESPGIVSRIIVWIGICFRAAYMLAHTTFVGHSRQ